MSKTPYFKTPIRDYYLDILVMPDLEHSPDDQFYKIEKKFEHRPDKLANELYGDPSYWYVFVLRNMDIIEDPIFDFVEGVEIRLPSNQAVRGIV